MNVFLMLCLWLLLLAVSWPLALVALFAWPLLWLVSLPFQLVTGVLTGIFSALKAILLFPLRLLGVRSTRV